MSAQREQVQLSPEELERRIRRLRRLARVMDSSIGIPGTKWRFGADAIVGLIPGVGDVATLVLSSLIVVEAQKMGVSRGTLLRMAANLGIDTLVGAVPALGDLFDLAFKANIRNMQLLEAELARMGQRPASEAADVPGDRLGLPAPRA